MALRRSLCIAHKMSRAFSSSRQKCAKESYRFAVVGGGAGGLSIASTLCRRFGKGATVVIEPSEVSLVHIQFVFGKPLDKSFTYKPEEVELSKKMMKYWANFAKTG